MRVSLQSGSAARALLVLVFVFLSVNAAFADGGRLRFRQAAGPFVVSLFTTPDPLSTGRADFSVAVERADAEGLVQDADVDLILTPADGNGDRLVLHASHAAATSKWLQAANFSLPAPGLWRVTVVVRQGTQAGQCSGDLLVKAAGREDVMWDVLPVPLAALLFVLHQNRKRRYLQARRSRQSLSDAQSVSPSAHIQRPGDRS